MRKNSREDWNKPIQELIRMMNEDYPNGYELVITTAGAEIRSTLTDMVFTDDSLTTKLRSIVNPGEELDWLLLVLKMSMRQVDLIPYTERLTLRKKTKFQTISTKK